MPPPAQHTFGQYWQTSKQIPPKFMSIGEYLRATRSRTWNAKNSDKRSQELKDVDREFFAFKNRCLGMKSLLQLFYKYPLTRGNSTSSTLNRIEDVYPSLSLPEATRNHNVIAMFADMNDYCATTWNSIISLRMKCENYIEKHRGGEPEPKANQGDLDLSAISPDLVGASLAHMSVPTNNAWRRIAGIVHPKPRVAACLILKDQALSMEKHFRDVRGSFNNWQAVPIFPKIPDYSEEIKLGGTVEIEYEEGWWWNKTETKAFITVRELEEERKRNT